MIVYELLVVGELLLALLTRNRKRGRDWFIFLSCLMLLAVMGLRDVYQIGNDTRTSYVRTFFDMKNLSFAQAIKSDPDGYNAGFYGMTKLLYGWTRGDYQLFIFLTSTFVILCFGHFVRRYSPSPFQSVLCFLGLLYYSFHFSALKQSIAMSILLLAFDQVVNRKMFRFLIMVGFASLFHFPSIVFLPAYWITKMKVGKNYLIFLALLLVLLYVLRGQILALFQEGYGTEVSDTGTRFIGNKVIIMIGIVAVSLILRNPLKQDRLYQILLLFMGISICIQTFASYSNTFERLADYYFQFAVVFIPLVFEKGAKRESLLAMRTVRFINDILPILFCAFAIYRFLGNMAGDGHFNPYQFYFQR